MAKRTIAVLPLLLSGAALFAGCTTSSAPVASDPSGVVISSSVPQRSYLDPGPAPARQGGPNYVRENAYGSPDAGTLLGRDSLPR